MEWKVMKDSGRIIGQEAFSKSGIHHIIIFCRNGGYIQTRRNAEGEMVYFFEHTTYVAALQDAEQYEAKFS